jgi:hypothetical protein
MEIFVGNWWRIGSIYGLCGRKKANNCWKKGNDDYYE